MPRRRHVKHMPFTKAQVHVIEKLAKKEVEEEVPVRYQLQILSNNALGATGTSISIDNVRGGPTADATKPGIIDTSGGVQYVLLNAFQNASSVALAQPQNGYERSKLKYLHFKSMIDCGSSEACLVRIEVLQYLDVPTDVTFVPYYPNLIPTAGTTAAAPNAITLSAMSALSPDISWITAPAARDFGIKYKWLHRETMYFDSVQNYAFRPYEFKLTEKHLGKRALQEFDEQASVRQNKNPIYMIVYSLTRVANNVVGTAMWQPATARLSGNYLTYLFQDLNK